MAKILLFAKAAVCYTSCLSNRVNEGLLFVVFFVPLQLKIKNKEKVLGQYRPIRDDIRKYHKSTGCIVCGSLSDLIIDHKNDLYNDLRVLNIKTQKIDDFQCLCNHCNLQKRQIAKKTFETGRRYGATKIPQLAIFGVDFIEGDETYDKDDINAMVGTYWYDPIKFLEHLKSQ